MLNFVKTALLLALSLLAAAAAFLVPAHLRSVDPVVLAQAGDQGRSPAERLRSELDAAHLGPARLMADAVAADAGLRETLRVREAELTALNPVYRASGGPAPYFETFLTLVQRNLDSESNNGVISLLLSRDARQVLAGLLADSGNRNVRRLVGARDVAGLIQLHPASHAAGAPYDAGILLLASLVNGGHLVPSFADRLGGLAEQAVAGDPAAVEALEKVVIDSLSIGRRLDYRSTASVAALSADRLEWSEIARLFRAYPEDVPLIFTSILFEGSPAPVHDYLLGRAETGIADLSQAAQEGEAALRFLLAADQPVFRAEGPVAQALQRLDPLRPAAATALVHGSAPTGLLLKAGGLFFAGLLFAFAMGCAWRASIGDAVAVSRWNPSIFARDAFLAVVFALTVWIFAEPGVLRSADPEAPSGPRIEFASAFSLDSLQSPVRIMQELNQVTLLVLVLFFVLQLVIYCFCLVKLREIRKQKLNAETKLRLLENEEYLFDFGLYVGLGGTVLSLILVAVGIVEASLMAAYASTLFGILFVALLKVLNLRPYRRRLILESGQGTRPETAALMKDIEL